MSNNELLIFFNCLSYSSKDFIIPPISFKFLIRHSKSETLYRKSFSKHHFQALESIVLPPYSFLHSNTLTGAIYNSKKRSSILVIKLTYSSEKTLMNYPGASPQASFATTAHPCLDASDTCLSPRSARSRKRGI